MYFAYAASYFSPVRLVGVVGDDCPAGFLGPLEAKADIDMSGLEVRPGSKTFRWHGRYHEDVNLRDTVGVDLNVLAEAGPQIPQEFRDSRYVFLANTHPSLQAEMLAQLDGPKLVVADTMDLWITTEREALMQLLRQIDGLVLNDSEAKLLTEDPNVVSAGLEIAKCVRRFVVVKKGEHGSLLISGSQVRPLASYPAANVIDPTGAGDSFAGAMMGHVAAEDRADLATLCRAASYGTITASFCLEGFSLGRFLEIGRGEIEERMREFRELTSF